jgi:hypothetical protein
VTLEEHRLIEVYDSSDAAELGSAEAPEFYSRDHLLYLRIRDELMFTDVPRGVSSND